MISDIDLENWFTYHSLSEDQKQKTSMIRAAGLAFARTIVELTPPSADQSAAIRLIREATFTANGAISCSPKKA